VVNHAAVKWEVLSDSVRVFLSDGSIAEGRTLLLAAGVVGTLSLVFASCGEVQSASFGDHAPLMLYTTLKKGGLPTVRADGVKHFNTLAIEKIVNDKVAVFASLYRLSHAPLSLLLAMLKLPPLIRGMSIPGLMNLLTPIQLWTEATQMRYRLERGRAEALVDVPVDTSNDAELAGFVQWLKPRAKVWKTASPTPGGGFHFCAARVGFVNGSEISLDAHLRQTQRGRVVAVDASVLTELGCRPSALTMMANSRRTVERWAQN
jgi:choline dehydrogenase-like flavoprotein